MIVGHQSLGLFCTRAHGSFLSLRAIARQQQSPRYQDRAVVREYGTAFALTRPVPTGKGVPAP